MPGEDSFYPSLSAFACESVGWSRAALACTPRAMAILSAVARSMPRCPDIKRFVFEGLREVYRRSIEVCDNQAAMKALSMLLAMAKEEDEGREELGEEVERLRAEVGAAEQLLFGSPEASKC